jgi:NUDIX domain
VLRSIPKTSTGFVIMADWNKYYKSVGIEPAPRRDIESIYLFRITVTTDPLICERDMLRAVTRQWANSHQLQLRLTESCLQTAGSNACAAIVGSEDDLMTLTLEGLSVLNSADTQEDDRAYQMLRIPIDDILENGEETIRSIAQSQVAENGHEGDVSTSKMCHHLKVFLSKKDLLSPPLIDYCRKHSIQTDQLCLLLLVQLLPTAVDFDLPGGTRRLGETSMAALLRKLREESGLKLRNLTISNHLDGDIKQSTLHTIKLEDTFDCYLTRLHS